jgi:hypothetical protein
MNLEGEARRMGVEESSIWVSAEVTADVNFDQRADGCVLLPLDVFIIVDNS